MQIRARIAALIAALIVVVFGVGACSGGPSGDAAFRTDGARAPVEPAATASQESSGAKLPRNLPPASMFLGAGSHRTTPVRYCIQGDCADLKPGAAPALEGPSGSPVLFSLSAAPRRAKLDVVKPGSSAPDAVALTPGSAIAWQPELPPGGYRLTLTAVYETTEVSWAFTLKIVEGKRR